MKRLLDFFDLTEDVSYIEKLRSFMIAKDYLSPADKDINLIEVMKMARRILQQRGVHGEGHIDGLDGCTS